jgi:hypothetical protein
MKTLSKIRESKNSLETQLKELMNAKTLLVEQTRVLKQMTESLKSCIPPDAGRPVGTAQPNPLD